MELGSLSIKILRVIVEVYSDLLVGRSYLPYRQRHGLSEASPSSVVPYGWRDPGCSCSHRVVGIIIFFYHSTDQVTVSILLPGILIHLIYQLGKQIFDIGRLFLFIFFKGSMCIRLKRLRLAAFSATALLSLHLLRLFVLAQAFFCLIFLNSLLWYLNLRLNKPIPTLIYPQIYDLSLINNFTSFNRAYASFMIFGRARMAIRRPFLFLPELLIGLLVQGFIEILSNLRAIDSPTASNSLLLALCARINS